MFKELEQFLKTEPRLPDASEKDFVPASLLDIRPEQSREEISAYLHRKALDEKHPLAILSLYAYRDMENTDWRPFVKAALERNPVCIRETDGLAWEEVVRKVEQMPNESIYAGNRLAQPDEVWNFGTGDGAEKAFLLWNIAKSRNPEMRFRLSIAEEHVQLQSVPDNTVFWKSTTSKQIKQTIEA